MASLSESLIKLDQISDYYERCFSASQNEEFLCIDDIPSDLDAYDYLFSIVIGICGAMIASSESFGLWLEKIHDAASGASGEYDTLQKFLGKLFEHSNQYIDYAPGEKNFANRRVLRDSSAPHNARPLFHRLLWGHDIFEIRADNPFYLMWKQEGIVGLVNAVRHLLGDTTSRQGLPLPFSSYLDYEVENGDGSISVSNYLIKIATDLSQETTNKKNSAEAIYRHLFTVRAQDLAGNTAVKVLAEAYLQFQKYTSETRKQQVRVISYSVAFFMEAIIGAVKSNGVPYINIPLAVIAMGSVIKLCLTSETETKELEEATILLLKSFTDLETSEKQLRGEILESLKSTLSEDRDVNRKEFINYLGEN